MRARRDEGEVNHMTDASLGSFSPSHSLNGAAKWTLSERPNGKNSRIQAVLIHHFNRLNLLK